MGDVHPFPFIVLISRASTVALQSVTDLFPTFRVLLLIFGVEDRPIFYRRQRHRTRYPSLITILFRRTPRPCFFSGCRFHIIFRFSVFLLGAGSHHVYQNFCLPPIFSPTFSLVPVGVASNQRISCHIPT